MISDTDSMSLPQAWLITEISPVLFDYGTRVQ
jgi:hypothetical protein